MINNKFLMKKFEVKETQTNEWCLDYGYYSPTVYSELILLSILFYTDLINLNTAAKLKLTADQQTMCIQNSDLAGQKLDWYWL